MTRMLEALKRINERPKRVRPSGADLRSDPRELSYTPPAPQVTTEASVGVLESSPGDAASEAMAVGRNDLSVDEIESLLATTATIGSGPEPTDTSFLLEPPSDDDGQASDEQFDVESTPSEIPSAKSSGFLPPPESSSAPKSAEDSTAFERTIRDDVLHARRGQPFRQLAERIRGSLVADVPASISFAAVLGGPSVAGDVARAAAALASQSNGRVLLVDAGAGGEGLSTCFGCGELPGLIEVLQRRRMSSECIIATTLSRLDFMPVGQAMPTDVGKTSQALAGLLHDLKRRYSLVVIDAGMADAALACSFSRYCDATFLVVQLGQTDEAQAQTAANSLREAGARLLGCVVIGGSSD